MFDRFILELALDLIIITGLLVVIATIRYFLVSWNFETVNHSTIKFCTGDLVSVSYPQSFGAFVRVFTASIWSHVGVIWVDPQSNEVFVLEMANYDQDRGRLCLPLSTWLKINRRCVIGFRQLHGNLSPIKLKQSFDQHQRVSLDSFNPGWYRLLTKIEHRNHQRQQLTCYEFIVSLLQDVDVIQPLWNCSSYFPSDLMMSSLNLQAPFRYGTTRQLVIKD